MLQEATGASGRRIAADAGIEKGQLPFGETRGQVKLDIGRVLILLGDAVSEKDDPVALLEKEVLGRLRSRPVSG